jgi:hypothetical protein
VYGKRRISCNLLRLGNQMEAGSRQCRRVQNLTSSAGGLWTFMLVEQRRARGDVEQHQATQDGQGLVCEPSLGCRLQTHTDTLF